VQRNRRLSTRFRLSGDRHIEGCLSGCNGHSVSQIDRRLVAGELHLRAERTNAKRAKQAGELPSLGLLAGTGNCRI
jgi:hypothetical protein